MDARGIVNGEGIALPLLPPDPEAYAAQIAREE